MHLWLSLKQKMRQLLIVKLYLVLLYTREFTVLIIIVFEGNKRYDSFVAAQLLVDTHVHLVQSVNCGLTTYQLVFLQFYLGSVQEILQVLLVLLNLSFQKLSLLVHFLGVAGHEIKF